MQIKSVVTCNYLHDTTYYIQEQKIQKKPLVQIVLLKLT